MPFPRGREHGIAPWYVVMVHGRIGAASRCVVLRNRARSVGRRRRVGSAWRGRRLGVGGGLAGGRRAGRTCLAVFPALVRARCALRWWSDVALLFVDRVFYHGTTWCYATGARARRPSRRIRVRAPQDARDRLASWCRCVKVTRTRHTSVDSHIWRVPVSGPVYFMKHILPVAVCATGSRPVLDASRASHSPMPKRKIEGTSLRAHTDTHLTINGQFKRALKNVAARHCRRVQGLPRMPEACRAHRALY